MELKSNLKIQKSGYDTSVLKKKYEDNPFVADGRFHVPTRAKHTRLDTAGPLALTDSKTGETVDVAEVRRVREVDSDRFVKLFVSQLNVFFELKPGTLKLMTALIDELSQAKYANGDLIYVNYNQVRRYFDRHESKMMARSTFMLSLTELVEKGFIAPSTLPNLWYINPAIFFNGDRIRFITEIRKKKVSAAEALEAKGQARLPLVDE